MSHSVRDTWWARDASWWSRHATALLSLFNTLASALYHHPTDKNLVDFAEWEFSTSGKWKACVLHDSKPRALTSAHICSEQWKLPSPGLKQLNNDQRSNTHICTGVTHHVYAGMYKCTVRWQIEEEGIQARLRQWRVFTFMLNPVVKTPGPTQVDKRTRPLLSPATQLSKIILLNLLFIQIYSLFTSVQWSAWPCSHLLPLVWAKLVCSLLPGYCPRNHINTRLRHIQKRGKKYHLWTKNHYFHKCFRVFLPIFASWAYPYRFAFGRGHNAPKNKAKYIFCLLGFARHQHPYRELSWQSSLNSHLQTVLGPFSCEVTQVWQKLILRHSLPTTRGWIWHCTLCKDRCSTSFYAQHTLGEDGTVFQGPTNAR